MILDVDFLISFFEKNSQKNLETEIGEQEAAGSAPQGGSSGSKPPPKWEDIYGQKKGKANPKTAGGPKWETGLTRGVANQIW